jgi:hypothetical protein
MVLAHVSYSPIQTVCGIDPSITPGEAVAEGRVVSMLRAGSLIWC